MRNWPMIKVADEFDLQMGKTPARDNPAYWGGEQKWASIADIARSGMYLSDTKEAITQEAVSESGIKAVPQNTVVMSFKLSLGRTAITASRMYTNEAIMAFLPHDATAFDLHFLYHLFSNRNWSEGCNKAVKGVTLNKATLNAARIPKPDISEQRAVASTLDKICALMAKCDEQIVRLDQLVKSRFVEMFGNELEQGRWPSTTVGEVANVCVGVVIKPTQYYQESGIRAFRSLNIGEMVVKDDDWVFFSETGHAKNQKSVVHRNDVLVVRSGAPGTACVVPEHFDGCNAVDIIIARPDCNKVDPTFLAMFTNMPHGKNQIRNQIGGAAQQHYNVGGYKKLQLIAPPLPLQREFAAFVAKVDKLAFAARQRREVAKQLYRAKIQEFFG